MRGRANLRACLERMGLDDKISNKGESFGGKAKEAVGKATGDEELENQGKGDQVKADLKDGVEKIKDAFKK
ncbi:MAG: CsbD family protein [Nocardioidaceae bacterium]|nr:CsbD family protein [Nocardioidaceae bacterium]